ncbi:MAG: hypothetical protein MRERV_7c092 [Mycoplasmataceae bacterium RV_VA103A]|nr:MAG: hypothetical protein MRERV_7c092 [Mycoplasmataceae bacterium RV_VA103A]
MKFTEKKQSASHIIAELAALKKSSCYLQFVKKKVE